MQKIDILGTEYTVLEQSEIENPKLEDANGLCELYSKQIILETDLNEEGAKKYCNIKDFKKKVFRHEIIHAFLHESGLCSSSEWARNEEVVDWMAIQFPKLAKKFEELDIM